MEADRAPEFKVRLASASDAPRLSRIAIELFLQAFAGDNRPEDIAAYVTTAFGERQQRAELEDPESRMWLVEAKSGELVGYAHVRLRAAPPTVSARRPVELARLYADRAWHGSGVAQKLMAMCINAAREWDGDVLWLGVWERNSRAIAFYEKQGFRSVGEQAFQLGADRQRDFVMARSLGSAHLERAG